LNAGKHTANQPARLAQLDDGNDRAIVEGHQGPAQIVRLGHRGTPSIDVSDEIAILAARPIGSSSTWAREVGRRAPTAAKLNGSTKPAVDAHRRPSIGSYPAPGQEGKDIVVLDRWGEDRTEGAVSSLARSRLVSVL